MEQKSLAWSTIYVLEERLNNGYYQNEDELLADMNSAVCDIQNKRTEFRNRVNKMKKCLHSYGDPWYTERHQLFFDIMYTFNRKCVHCGYVDSYESRTFKDLPEWAEVATLRYTNKNIL